MGVVSRQVMPACGGMCFFCPSLRTRSRQPVKRYKKLLAGVFPLSQDGEPNHRMISKLCDYASKNPLRVPKIAKYLEQRCYKELRGIHISKAKVVPCVYRKMLISCKQQMPLFAFSVLSVIRTLLEQSQQYDMQILGCNTLVDFLDGQTDSTYMFDLEGLIPKLCQLAQEVGEVNNAFQLRSAALQAIASMVHFMGKYSHMSTDFNNIVSATLENYEFLEMKAENDDDSSFTQSGYFLERQVPRFECDKSGKVVTPHKSANIVLDSSLDENPGYWSRICLHNIAGLAKEATTVRHVLEPIFHYLDSRNHWSPRKRTAQCILNDIQISLEKSGENSNLLLSILVKHLDHKNVTKEPDMQLDIIEVIIVLTQRAKLQSSITIYTTINNLMGHLYKCLKRSIEEPDLDVETKKWNHTLYCTLTDCLLQLTNKVGDIGPVLDMMAVVLENISVANAVSRATMLTVYHTARIISSLPNIPYCKKAFPEALFHQLLLAMTHPDHETRVGSHSVFCAIVVPSMVIPWSMSPLFLSVNKCKPQGATLSVFSDLDKHQNSVMNSSLRDGRIEQGKDKIRYDGQLHTLNSKQCTDFTTLKREDPTLLQLSSYQVELLLSSIWVQATSLENIPANYEAIAYTFNLILISYQVNASSISIIVQCFQLALSLRILSLDQESLLSPCSRRSLFTTASSMLIFSAKASEVVDIIQILKSDFAPPMDDPYLHLIEDNRLQSVCASDSEVASYGSNNDTCDALKFLLAIKTDDNLLKELVISRLLNKFENLSKVEISSIREQLMQQFSPDIDIFPHGAPLFMETPQHYFSLAQKENQYPNQNMPCSSYEDEDFLPEPCGDQPDQIMPNSINACGILNVNQLIESVLETARQVASMPVSTASIPYEQMKSQCEALGVEKQHKMSLLQSFKQQNEAVLGGFLKENEERISDSEKAIEFPEAELKLTCNNSSENKKFFRLPPSSPYDKFLRAAGC